MAQGRFSDWCADNERVQRWASAQMVKSANGWLTVFWLFNFPPIIALYLGTSPTRFAAICLLYLALVSIWANVASHFAGWVAGRVEVKQEEQIAAS